MKVKAFKASKFLISNGEYLEFYNSGCYDNERFWSKEGWEWKQRSNTKHPLFWVADEENKG